MTVTFLVELNLDDTTDLANISGDIEEDLQNNFEVISVKPWARPTGNPLAALPNLTEIQPPTL